MPNGIDRRYRTVTRRTAVALMLLVISLGPARVQLTRHAQPVAITAGAMTWALALVLFWYRYWSLWSESMPPQGSWVAAGQRIRTGPEAVRQAKRLLVTSAALCLLGLLAAAMMWSAATALLASPQAHRRRASLLRWIEVIEARPISPPFAEAFALLDDTLGRYRRWRRPVI